MNSTLCIVNCKSADDINLLMYKLESRDQSYRDKKTKLLDIKIDGSSLT